MPILSAQDRVGTLIKAKYRLDRILGEGGMGVVYAAEHVQLRRAVAVKFLLPHLATNADLVARFLAEARTASSLRHPNVVDVLDVDTSEDGVPYFVMEMLEGTSLAAHLAQAGTLAPNDAWRVLGPAMLAVKAAHERGVIHRDLKPDNLFLHHFGGELVPKVVDFGIAKVAEGTSAGLTNTGALLGTVQYMAPEQVQAQGIGPWTDVWAMGVVWYEVLAGQHPLGIGRDMTPTLALVRIMTERARPLAAVLPAAPPALANVIDRALAHDPAARPANMGVFHAELRGALAATSSAPIARTLVEPRPAPSSGPQASSASSLPAPPLAGPQSPPAPPPPAPIPPSPFSPLVLAGAGLAAMLVLAATALGIGYAFSTGDPPPPPSPEAAATDATPPSIASPSPSALRCPAGFVGFAGASFLLGSPDGRGRENERPQTTVHLTDAYCLARTETTVASYRECVMRGDCEAPHSEPRFPEQWDPDGSLARAMAERCNYGAADRDEHPVNCVDWTQASAYCASLGGRLPTEAEWELAAVGTAGRAYPWGQEPPDRARVNGCGAECGDARVPSYVDADPFPWTAPVGSFPLGASPEGVLDLSGNVWEWTHDLYVAHLPGGTLRSPTGPEAGEGRVYRGGGYRSRRFGDVDEYRARYREGLAEEMRGDDLGFRCVVPPEGGALTPAATAPVERADPLSPSALGWSRAREPGGPCAVGEEGWMQPADSATSAGVTPTRARRDAVRTGCRAVIREGLYYSFLCCPEGPSSASADDSARARTGAWSPGRPWRRVRPDDWCRSDPGGRTHQYCAAATTADIERATASGRCEDHGAALLENGDEGSCICCR